MDSKNGEGKNMKMEINEKGNEEGIFKNGIKIEKKEEGSIFGSEGPKRVKKTSEFLKTKFVEISASKSDEKQEEGMRWNCNLFYMEDDEWITLGEGVCHLYHSKFVFIRNALRTVLLNFNYKSVKFDQKDEDVYFIYKIRRASNDKTELIDRQYKIVFSDASHADEFIDHINDCSNDSSISCADKSNLSNK